jgi:hypothetical protein
MGKQADYTVDFHSPKQEDEYPDFIAKTSLSGKHPKMLCLFL